MSTRQHRSVLSDGTQPSETAEKVLARIRRSVSRQHIVSTAAPRAAARPYGGRILAARGTGADPEVDCGRFGFDIGQPIRDRERSAIPLEFLAGSALEIGQGVRESEPGDGRIVVELLRECGK